MRDFSKTRFRKRIALTDEHYYYINQNKGKKSAAGLLEQIIKEYAERNNKSKSIERSPKGAN